jgi:hypothetical protein
MGPLPADLMEEKKKIRKETQHEATTIETRTWFELMMSYPDQHTRPCEIPPPTLPLVKYSRYKDIQSQA